jgi:hypothetical protein
VNFQHLLCYWHRMLTARPSNVSALSLIAVGSSSITYFHWMPHICFFKAKGFWSPFTRSNKSTQLIYRLGWSVGTERTFLKATHVQATWYRKADQDAVLRVDIPRRIAVKIETHSWEKWKYFQCMKQRWSFLILFYNAFPTLRAIVSCQRGWY